MWLVGAARRQLEMDFSGLELLGWGQPHGRITRVEAPLQVRAVALVWGEERLVYVCAELCFITQGVRDGVRTRLAELGHPVAERELLIAATHTHSGPAGFAHNIFYNLTNPGHHPEVTACVVNTLADAAVGALARLEPGTVSLSRGEIPLDEPVAFNRALEALARNPDAPDFDPAHPETATNRELTVLRVDGAGPVAAICWFAVHNTSVHFDNLAVHGDNKGVAAALLEDHGREVLGSDDFVGIFAQGASGDVTPNCRPSNRGFTIGVHDDDFESAQAHGAIQARYAIGLLDDGRPLEGLSTGLRHIDFDGLEVDADLAGGREGRRTGIARYGLGVIEGTAEGPGPLWKAQFVRRSLVRMVALAKWGRQQLPGFGRWYADGLDDVYGPQFPFIEAGKGQSGRAFAVVPMHTTGVPAAIDPVVAEIQRLAAQGADLDSPWTQSVVPIHAAKIGDFALLSLPCEPTTVAGYRLVQTVLDGLDVSTVQIAGYSNAYSGYLTTREEYQVQAYEGGHTIFGQWTLGGYQTAIRRLLADGMGHDENGRPPQTVPSDELARRAYAEPPPSRSWG